MDGYVFSLIEPRKRHPIKIIIIIIKLTLKIAVVFTQPQKIELKPIRPNLEWKVEAQTHETFYREMAHKICSLGNGPLDTHVFGQVKWHVHENCTIKENSHGLVSCN